MPNPINRPLEVVAYALAVSAFLWRLSLVPRAHEPITLLQAVGLLALCGLGVVVWRASR